jgi:hypothetical protein
MVRRWLGLTNNYNLFHRRDLPPAILNAVYATAGMRVNELLITSKSIWRTLQEKK